jgi:hypothetical protein
VAAGLITLDELNSGVIAHALQFSIPNPLGTTGVYPAQRGDGLAANDPTWVGLGFPPTIPEGTWFRLRSSVANTVTTGYGTSFDTTAAMLRKALKTYGMIVLDRTSTTMQFRAEYIPDDATYPVYSKFNPGGISGFPAPYSDAFMAAALPPFTTSNWEVIDISYRPVDASGW